MNRHNFNRIIRLVAGLAAVDAMTNTFTVPADIEGDADLTELYKDEFEAARLRMPTGD